MDRRSNIEAAESRLAAARVAMAAAPLPSALSVGRDDQAVERFSAAHEELAGALSDLHRVLWEWAAVGRPPL